MRGVLLAACTWCACAAPSSSRWTADVGPPLAPANDLIVVAHQDDDLLFMQPDLIDLVEAHAGVTTVYVTAGNGAAPDLAYANARAKAVQTAYATAAGSDAWQCGWIELAGHLARHCRLDDANISLVFLGYPDGGLDGSFTGSLLQLWQGDVAGADTVAEHETHYDRDGLVDAVADVIVRTAPKTIRTLEVAATHGTDHPDHMLVGALALLAEAEANSGADLVSYRGYNVGDEPANRPTDLYARSFAMFTSYWGDMTGGGPITGAYPGWAARRYAIDVRRAASGAFATDGGCLVELDDHTVQIADCASATSWKLAGTELHDPSGQCLTAHDSGELDVEACAQVTAQRFFYDDDRHLWSGLPPSPAPDMASAHLRCVDADARASLCGKDLAPTWDAIRPSTVMPRKALGLSRSGRSIRIGDIDGDGLGDLCGIETRRLVCAKGDGTGGFAEATVVAEPFNVDPVSLTLADIDGDGHLDACGLALDGSGLACATFGNGFVVGAWSATFGASSVVGTPESLGGDSGELCALASDGVSCVRRDGHASVLSTWPPANATLWTADIDGDRALDWCVAGAGGVTCAPAGEPAVASTDGVPWTYVFAGTPARSPQDADLGSLADVDGDGRADLCGVADGFVRCAHSQGRGFGPTTTHAALPAGMQVRALWLGDLDGDGKADTCVDSVDSIACQLSP